MAKILSRDEILSANDIYIQELEVPEWGGSVYVKTLNGKERDELEAELVEFAPSGNVRKMKMDRLRSLLAFLGVCDADGNRLFSDRKDIDALAKKSASALDRVAAKIQTLAGISPADLDDLTAKLKNDQRAASPTD